jgi:peptidoglycan-N-acetylglucosamine deacetylase
MSNRVAAEERRSPIRQLVKRGMTTLLPRGAFMTSGPADSRAVALTFDDGPHPEHTPRLLDVMATLDVRGTFFLLGRNVEAHPTIVERIVHEGHTIGHHSYHHGEPERVSARELAEETARTDALLSSIVGTGAHLFRPPHGKLSAEKVLRLWAARKSIVLWNLDPKDFACRDAGEVVDHFERATIAGGDIVLLHDTHPHAAGALPRIAEIVRAAGLSFVTVDRWLPAARAR